MDKRLSNVLLEDLAVFIRMLSRSAVGSPITQYTSHFHGPQRGGELHVILVDNTRSARLGSADFWRGLKCIRCGACMNTCPVYRRGGGLSYGAIYSGPIGIILDPGYDERKYRELPVWTKTPCFRQKAWWRSVCSFGIGTASLSVNSAAVS